MNEKQSEISKSFSRMVYEYWAGEFPIKNSKKENQEISFHISLSATDELSILQCVDGQIGVSMSERIASKLMFNQGSTINDLNDIYERLSKNNLNMNGSDNLYYLSKDKLVIPNFDHPAIMLDNSHDSQVRAFQAKCSEEELDNAFVELDHWAVTGLFVNEQLVCMASAYPWDDSSLCDIGIITVPEMRRKGYAKHVLSVLCQHILDSQLIPQYRCQLDNLESISLAQSFGFKLFGTWDLLAA